MRKLSFPAASLIGSLALAASPGVLAQDRAAPPQAAQTEQEADAPDRAAQGNNRGYVVGKGGVARGAQGGHPQADGLPENAAHQAAEAVAQQRDSASPDGAAARQGEHADFLWHVGGARTRGNSDAANPGSSARIAPGTAPIGVNEPGVNRRHPQ